MDLKLLKSKTVKTGIVAILGAASGYLTGELAAASAIQIGLMGVIGIFLRDGIEKTKTDNHEPPSIIGNSGRASVGAMAITLAIFLAAGCAVTQSKYSLEHQDSRIIKILDASGLSPEVLAQICAATAINEIAIGTFTKEGALEKIAYYKDALKFGVSYTDMTEVISKYSSMYGENDPNVSRIAMLLNIIVLTQIQSMPDVQLPMLSADADVIMDLLDTIEDGIKAAS